MKKMKSPVIFILLLSITFGLLSTAAPMARAASDPEVEASAAILVELQTGQVLYSNNADGKIYPASTTKIMTVLLAVEAIENGSASLSDVVTVTSNVSYNMEAEAVTVDLQPGEQITLGDLLYCALVASANDACNAIAEYIGGTIDNFIAMMNTRAQELGCTGTHFTNANGLSDDNHYTTARDLYRIMNAAVSYPTFITIDSTAEYTVPATNLSEARSLTTTNKLLVDTSSYYYEYAVGGKTGYTQAAGHCLVSMATKGDISLIAVVMGAESLPDANGVTDTKSFSESVRLYNWGFDNFSYRQILSVSDLVSSVPIIMGEGTDSVILCPETSLTALLDNEADPTSFTYEVEVDNLNDKGQLTAPISSGEVLGRVTVSDGDTVYGTVNLVSYASVSLSHIEFLKSEIRSTLAKPAIKLIFLCILLFFLLYTAYVIYYNRKRKRQKALKRAHAHKLLEDRRSNPATSTTGKSFEDIEDLFKDESKTH